MRPARNPARKGIHQVREQKNMNTQILGRALARASDHRRRLVEHAHLPLALFSFKSPFLQDRHRSCFIFRDGVDDERRELLAAELAPARSIAVARRGPNGLKIQKETTHFMVRWTRVPATKLKQYNTSKRRTKYCSFSPLPAMCLNNFCLTFFINLRSTGGNGPSGLALCGMAGWGWRKCVEALTTSSISKS